MADRRSRRLLRPLLALATLLGLAACSAGVPQTGEVVPVSPVTSTPPPVNPELLGDLGGPTSGQSESEVAVGFMNAMNTRETAIIQRWVMPGAAREQVARWSDPTTTIRVYSVFDPGPGYAADNGHEIVPIKVKLVGQLRGGRDWYPSSGEDVLKLEMRRDGADARVANPGPTVWMRDVNFSKQFTSTEVFMVPDLTDPSPQLAPVPVFVPSGAEGDPQAPAYRAKKALELLLKGPRNRYRNLESAIPDGTELESFRYAKDVATINLSRRFTERGSSGLLRIGQLVWTVNRLIPTASVRVLVESRAVRKLGDDQYPVGSRWNRADRRLAGMWPQRSEERAGDSILFIRDGEIYTVPPKTGQTPVAVGLNARSPKSAPTWSPDHRSMAFLVTSGARQSLWMVDSDGGQAVPATSELPGRFSPPSWSPDSKRVYLILRDAAGARLLEVSRSTHRHRFLALPPLPSGLQPASVAVSPDGAFLLAVANQPDRKVEQAEAVPGGQLFLGQLGPNGVLGWSRRQIAPGLGRVFSPVWVDPVTVAFIAETDSKDDLGRLWTMKSDGWNPTAVLNDSDIPIGDIGNHLTVDPSGRYFVITARSSSGAFLWLVNRLQKSVTYLTFPASNVFDTDPSFASR